MKITVPSFSKINWTLEILGKRCDGFHELLTVLQTLDFGDRISFEVECRDITLKTQGREISCGPDNLVHKAARLVKERAEIDRGAQITLTKRTPIGAGLGGGSSNAAITLLALNRLWDCRLTETDLLKLAIRLGSDVPFFLTGGTALGLGRGEQISVLPDLKREFAVLVYYPLFPVSAAEAYAAVRDLPDKLTRPDLDTTIRRFHEVLETGNWSTLRNDLERPIFSRYPVLARVKQDLIEAGCEFGMLSGSGSALFGISSANRLESAKEKLAESGDADIILCHTISRKKYADSLNRAGLQAILPNGLKE